jgi:hypothetical protein
MATLPPMGMFAYSAPDEAGREHVAAVRGLLIGQPAGIGARFATALFTWKYSAIEPSLVLANFQPPSIPPHWLVKPALAVVAGETRRDGTHRHALADA